MNELEIPNVETLAAFAELDNGGGEWFSGTTEDYIATLLEDKPYEPLTHSCTD
ncbi:MAG: hypothetical protein IJR72_04800 [Oscillospiraceae bacterium]|nr:hypothetical protein [Oscillospiraceae bacterium]